MTPQRIAGVAGAGLLAFGGPSKYAREREGRGLTVWAGAERQAIKVFLPQGLTPKRTCILLTPQVSDQLKNDVSWAGSGDSRYTVEAVFKNQQINNINQSCRAAAGCERCGLALADRGGIDDYLSFPKDYLNRRVSL